MNDSDPFELQVAYPDEESARAAANWLVREYKAACAQIAPITSVYRWEGEVVEDTEFLLTAKTTRACLDAIEVGITADHPYELPQITALPITAGSADYLAWIADSCVAPE